MLDYDPYAGHPVHHRSPALAPGASVVLIGDPRITAIPIREEGEPLVRLDPRLCRGGRAVHVRARLADRLAAAQRLLPAPIRLAVLVGHRRPADQQAILDRYAAELTARRPDLDHAALASLVSRHVAPLPNAPHVAGAAVDLTLVGSRDEELWLGSAVDETPERSQGRCYTAAPGLDALAASHRALLVAVLTESGLVNYPTEWWHWSLGDRYWAYVTGTGIACYAAVDTPVDAPDAASDARTAREASASR